MDELADWLPPKIKYKDDEGNVNLSIHEELYQEFCNSILNAQLNYDGGNVWLNRNKDKDGKEVMYWHLVSRGRKKVGEGKRRSKKMQTKKKSNGGNRELDFHRAVRLPWVNPLINQGEQHEEILNWDIIEDDEINTYIWYRQDNFMVVLQKYEDGRRRLKTSFYVDDGKNQRRYMGKYHNRVKQ